MTIELNDDPQALSAIPLIYRTLLDEYVRNRKEIQTKRSKEDRKLIDNSRDERKGISKPDSRTDGVGFWVANIDIFGNDVVFSGGMGVLKSMSTMDAGTIAALIEWNRINLVCVERKLFLRRSWAVLITGIGVVATLYKLIAIIHIKVGDESAYQIDMDVLSIVAKSVLGSWWQVLMWISLITFLVALELVIWRPGKLRIEEFGQLLAVGFAYTSSIKNKTSEVPKYEHIK